VGKTLKSKDRFDMDAIDNQEITDYLCRFFRHYHVGYDFYRPETWSPMTTFFSEDVERVSTRWEMLKNTFPLSFRHYG
jgi:hypothetical protein